MVNENPETAGNQPPFAAPDIQRGGEIHVGGTDDLSIKYESSDGELRAESQKQWYAPVETVGTLNDWFIDRPDVFIAGDLLVYYRMNDNRSLLFRRNFHYPADSAHFRLGRHRVGLSD